MPLEIVVPCNITTVYVNSLFRLLKQGLKLASLGQESTVYRLFFTDIKIMILNKYIYKALVHIFS